MSDDRFLKGSSLSKLLAGRDRPTRAFLIEVVRERGPESIALAVRTLSTQEQMQAHAEAMKWLVGTGGWLREDLVADAGDAVLNLEVMVQTLALALVDPTRTSAPFAASAAELRACFDVDEIRACFDEYSAHVVERSPFRSLKTLAEVREVADALGKGQASRSSLTRYDASSLRLIITALVDRAVKWTMASSSDTSPPSVSDGDSSLTSSTTPTTPRMTVSDEPPLPSQP